jgi:hypothetical protein
MKILYSCDTIIDVLGDVLQPCRNAPQWSGACKGCNRNDNSMYSGQKPSKWQPRRPLKQRSAVNSSTKKSRGTCLVTPRAQCRVKKPGRRTATRLATRRKVQGKVYNYKLVGNNGGTLGYAILEKGCFRFEVEVCPLQNFTSDTLRKIATVLDGFNAAKSEERDVQTN